MLGTLLKLKIATTSILALFLFMLMLPATSRAEKNSLCSSSESTFFSCSFTKKTVSLCEKKGPVGYLEYRYGTKERIEMTHRATHTTESKFKETTVLYASNSANVIWFSVSHFSYILNFPTRGGPSLEIRNEGLKVAEMSCKKGWEDVEGDPERISDFIIRLPESTSLELERRLSENSK